MDYEQRFFEHLIDSYMAAGDITEDEAILKIEKMKKEDPEEYQEELNEWFDTVHPYWVYFFNLDVIFKYNKLKGT